MPAPKYKCLECKHLKCENDMGWSDWTPGEGLIFGCAKDLWGRDAEFTPDGIRRSFEIGDNCEEFEKRK